MDQFFETLSKTEKFLYFGLGVGIICGLIPLILGILHSKQKLGYIGFIASVMGGCLVGLFFAGPISGFFIWKIVHKEKPENIDFDEEEEQE